MNIISTTFSVAGLNQYGYEPIQCRIMCFNQLPKIAGTFHKFISYFNQTELISKVVEAAKPSV